MLWRKALIATIILMVMSFVLTSVMSAIVTPIVESDGTWLEQMNWTAGSFIAMVSWLRQIIDALLIFLVVWWTLRTSLPTSDYKQKRTVDERPFSSEV